MGDSAQLFTIDSRRCFAGAIEGAGLSQARYDAALAALQPRLEALAREKTDGGLPLLAVPEQRDDLQAVRDVASALSESCDDILVLGTGGSSLGGQAIQALTTAGGLVEPSGGPRLIFVDNLDAHGFELLLAASDPARLGVVMISKSGGTIETLCQSLRALAFLREHLDESRLAAQMAVITEPKDSALKRLAERYRLPCLPHNTGVGGRFAVLTNVGMLPVCLLGLDPEKLRRGAAAVLEDQLANGAAGPAEGAALAFGLLEERGISQSVLMPYGDRLRVFGAWYRQLWAESLGKDGKGLTPIAALGPVDQHSQVQLFLAGPKDKLFTLLWLDTAGEGAPIEALLAEELAIGQLPGRRMGELLLAEAKATADSLALNGCPLRTITFGRLDEEVLGGLFMHFMLETILTAHLLGVDPFDQPAVEQGKQLARDYLARMGEG